VSDRLINVAVVVYRRSMKRWREEGHSEADIRAFVERDLRRQAKRACKGLSPLATKLSMDNYRRSNERILAILFPEPRS
jgi:hypothetical protein